MKRLIAILLTLALMTGAAALAETGVNGTVEGTGGSSNLRTGPGLDYEVTGEFPGEGSSLPYGGETETDDRGVDWYSVWLDDTYCWVSSKYTTLTSEEIEEPTEGAPVLPEGRRADTDPVEDFAGEYEGSTYSVSLSIYSDIQTNEYGNITITERDSGSTVCSEALVYGVMDNWYELHDADINFTVFTQDGVPCMELAINGEVVDTLTRTTVYFS